MFRPPYETQGIQALAGDDPGEIRMENRNMQKNKLCIRNIKEWPA